MKYTILTVFAFLRFAIHAQNSAILIPYQDESTRLWGYVDENKTVMIPHKYSSANQFSDGLAQVVYDSTVGDAKNHYLISCTAFIDTKGQVAFQCKRENFRFVKDFQNGLAKAIDEYNKEGLINKKGEIVLPINCDYIKEFSGGYAIFAQKNQIGVVDTLGKIVIQPKYQDIGTFYKNVACFSEKKEIFSKETNGFVKKKLYGLVDITGHELSGAKFDFIDNNVNGFWRISTNKKWGFIDINGKVIVEPIYDNVENFELNDGKLRAKVKVVINNEYGVSIYENEYFIDENGKPNIKSSADYVGKYSEGLARFVWDEKGESLKLTEDVAENETLIQQEEGISGADGKALILKFGYIDKNGTEVIPRQFERAENFHGGIAKVRRNKKYGIIDKTGKEVVPIIYDAIGDFHEGLAWVKSNGQIGYVNKEGQVIIPLSNHTSGGDFHEDMAWFLIVKNETVNQQKAYSYSHDQNGKLQADVTTEQGTKKFKYFGYINKQGAEVIAPSQYNAVSDFENGKAKVTDIYKSFFIDKQGKVVQ